VTPQRRGATRLTLAGAGHISQDEGKSRVRTAATMTQNERERSLLLNRTSGRSGGQAAP
jgi:hypothetical protein